MDGTCCVGKGGVGGNEVGDGGSKEGLDLWCRVEVNVWEGVVEVRGKANEAVSMPGWCGGGPSHAPKGYSVWWCERVLWGGVDVKEGGSGRGKGGG